MYPKLEQLSDNILATKITDFVKQQLHCIYD